ncbi:SpoIIE family protein phosphatase [Modestobacter versicolor]|uniref:Uncharacterized protein n=1 Tax=Modestobacter versicolor TaxID=429133 RepID=A0A323V8H6_9ACTN|nr:SpoIIE family protein phosphatase [Modestobacter versicolor]PZA20360.1 hypothetical protein DMO24_15905 [Modestobacter versicolor]
MQLTPGDRVLSFTDGVVEERLAGGDHFGSGSWSSRPPPNG